MALARGDHDQRDAWFRRQFPIVADLGFKVLTGQGAEPIKDSTSSSLCRVAV